MRIVSSKENLLLSRRSSPSTSAGRVESLPRNLKKERIISPMAIMAEDFDSNFPKKIQKKIDFWSKNSKSGSKRTKLALNPNPIKIRGFLCNFRPIWAISSQTESLESSESCNLEKISKKIQPLAKKFKNGPQKR